MEAVRHGVRKVMVIDDDPITVDLAVASLRRIGVAEIVTASNGAAGLLQLDGNIDITMVDLQMPGMDGLGFVDALGKHGYQGALVLISGARRELLHQASQHALLRGLNLLGALAKPIVTAELASLLAHFCPANSQAAQPVIDQQALRKALDEDRIAVHYQPQIDVEADRVVGLEALLRWQYPGHGLVLPESFIPVAEQVGLIGEVTKVALRQVAADSQRIAAIAPELTVSVNVSEYGLACPDVLAEFVNACQAHDVSPDRILLELSEDQIAQRESAVTRALADASRAGFGWTLDQFVGSRAALRAIRTQPPRSVKVPPFVLQGAVDSAEARSQVLRNARIADEHGVPMCVVGVDSAPHLDLVRDLGAKCLQGFMFARPMPLGELLEWLPAAAGEPSPMVPAPRSVWDPTVLDDVLGEDRVEAERFVHRVALQAAATHREVETFLTARNYERVAAAVQRIQPSCFAVGATVLGGICRDLVVAAQSHDEDRISAFVAEFGLAVAELETALAAVR